MHRTSSTLQRLPLQRNRGDTRAVRRQSQSDSWLSQSVRAADGDLDPTFGTAGKRTDFGDHDFDRARSAVLQPDGKIFAAGFAISHNGGVQNFAVARYGANGILDPTFSGDGITQIDFGSCCQSAYGVLLQPDGTIVALGFHPTASNRFAEFAAVRYLGSAGSFSLSLP